MPHMNTFILNCSILECIPKIISNASAIYGRGIGDYFRNALTKFESITGIITLYHLLHPLSYITERLQGRTTDIVYTYSNIQETIDDLNHLRKNVEKETIYQQATRMASKLFVELTIPKITMRQVYRNKLPAESPHEYYKRALIIPFLDTIISEIKIRFQKTNCIAVKILCLIPSIICSEEITAFQELVKIYKSDLPNSEAVDQELMFWKRKWSVIKHEERPNTLAKAIKICNENQYSNPFELLKIGCTLPVTSAECERNFSAMRKLRVWLRASMTADLVH
ncbi:52 kDa repressor of the inhibitor of the protein kinase-like [Hydra vulgaris]|uniref:52 kDa repressor of the inhibitor of the protein kinase-like n=1 Tax=Hydra vulgaris TaxID=6087 RepID=A0ABM4D143_HYDVU